MKTTVEQGTALGPVDEVGGLVRRAAGGDETAWDSLVQRYSRLVWAIARNSGLRDSDAAEVSQTTWLRLVEHLDRIEHPERVAAWLATTTRRECFRVRHRAERETVVSDDLVFDRAEAVVIPMEGRVVAGERHDVLRAAFETLPERARSLLVLLHAEPALSYAEISETLDMPIGSIGPTRQRALAVLRRAVERLGVHAADIG